MGKAQMGDCCFDNDLRSDPLFSLRYQGFKKGQKKQKDNKKGKNKLQKVS